LGLSFAPVVPVEIMPSSPFDRRHALRPLRRRSAAHLTILFYLLRAGTCFADCGPSEPLVALSANQVYRLDLKPLSPGRFGFTLRRNGVILNSEASAMDVQCGHLSAIVADTGSCFVLRDEYDGLAIFDGQGRQIANFKADDLLTARELATRPDGWPCHPEGRWALESGAMSFVGDGTTVEVITHAGRKILIDPATGRIVRAELDPVQSSFAAGLASAAVAAAAVIRRLRRRNGRI
jgi:hypothetical protein